MKFILKSPYPCLVKTGEEEFSLDQNDLLEIENEKTLFVYPQNPAVVPFCVDLTNSKDNEKFSFFSRGETKFLILENPPTFVVKNKEKLNFSGKIVEIYVGKNSISFETPEKKIDCATQSSSQNFSCFKIKNFAAVQFEKELFLFSVKEGKVFHFAGEIEIDGNQITVTKKFFDSEMREKKSVFRVEEEIELEDEEFVCTENLKTERKKIKDLAPFKLLESVKAKDYAHALTFLSEKLKSQIDAAQIKDFFGNVAVFLPLSTTEFITLNEKNKNFVQFSLDGNFVDDISVDNL